MNKAIRRPFVWLLIFFSLSVSLTVFSQERSVIPSITRNFAPLTGVESVSDTYILDTLEDSYGLLWFASSGGLVQFDGYASQAFLYEADNDNSLPNNVVRKLLLTKRGVLYVGTLEGLARFNRQNETFTRIPVKFSDINIDVVDIAESQNGQLLVLASDDIYYLDDDGLSLIELNKNVKYPQSMSSILDEPDKIWIGTYNNGGYIYDKTQKQLFSLDNANPWSLNIPSDGLRTVKRIKGKYWMGTDEGLVYYKNGLYLPPITFQTKKPVFSIILTDKGLVAISNAEMLEINENNSNYDLVSESYFESGGLFSFFLDSNDTSWLGTDSGVKFKTTHQNTLPIVAAKPLMQNDKNQAELDSLDIWGIDEDSKGNIWSASQASEIQRYDLSTGQLTRFETFDDIKLWDLVVDDNDQLWVAAGEAGIHKVTVTSANMLPDCEQVVDHVVYSIHHFNNKLWFVDAENYLSFFDTNSDDKTAQRSLSLDDMVNPRVIQIDSQQRLWLSGQNSTRVFDLKTGTEIQTPSFYKQLSTLVGVFEQDSELWLLTHNVDLVRVEPSTLLVINQLSMNTAGEKAYSGLAGKRGLWVASNSSIALIDLQKKHRAFEINTAQLQHNKLYEGVSLKTKSGYFIFGGKYGYNIFNPEQFVYQNNTKVATRVPQIREFRLNSQKMPFNETQSPLSKPIYLMDAIELRYIDKRFSFGFALTNPQFPEQVEYRYKLNGYDTEWLNNTEFLGRNAVFYNLPWGKYFLEVQAKEPSKLWSESKKLTVTILPPPWFSTPAVGLYGALFILCCFFAFRQWKNRSISRKRILESEERLKLTLWSSGDELWDWDIARGQVHRSNTWGSIDFPQDDIRTNSAYNGNIHEADIDNVTSALNAHLRGDTEYYQVSYRIMNFKKQWLWVLDRGKVVERDHNRQALRMTGTLKDIQYLKESEEQFRLFERSFENISEGVFITDTAFKFISVNTAYCKFTGETKERALASYLYFHQYPAAFTEEVRKSLFHKHNWSGEIESKRINGESYEIELNIDAVIDPDGNVSHYVGVFSDISERKATEKELLKLSNADPLTELPNRSFFQASQQNLVRKGEPHSLLCLDMDNFKKINDSLGHQTGDVLIKQIAKRLQRLIGNTATCYRLGGDEFSILVEEEGDIHRMAHYAQSVLDNLSRPFIINKQEYVLSASVGIAQFPYDGVTPQELLKNADTAMYFAKNAGGNAYKFFSSEMNQSAVRQLQIENLIRQGLKDDLFTVFYQPKVDIASGRLVSMEALVRFEHPEKGIVPPGQFIPLAEQSGQIVEIGDVVLEKALRDTKRWVDAGLFTGRVAVNISAKQFEQSNLDEKIELLLKKVGISSMHLECEITEGTLMENPEDGLALMERLRNRGVHLALDDFGTGYSSLAYLKRFPLNTLKIDKAFIDDIAHSSQDRHMAAAIINIAHNLGLTVVAEGVEYEEQLEILRRYDCETLQGYLYSKPLRSDKFEKLLLENMNLKQFLSASYGAV